MNDVKGVWNSKGSLQKGGEWEEQAVKIIGSKKNLFSFSKRNGKIHKKIFACSVYHHHREKTLIEILKSITVV